MGWNFLSKFGKTAQKACFWAILTVFDTNCVYGVEFSAFYYVIFDENCTGKGSFKVRKRYVDR